MNRDMKATTIAAHRRTMKNYCTHRYMSEEYNCRGCCFRHENCDFDHMSDAQIEESYKIFASNR